VVRALDGFERAEALEVSVDRKHRWQFDRSSVIAHHVVGLSECDVAQLDAIPTTSVERTLADLGSVVRDPTRIGRALTDARRGGSGSAPCGRPPSGCIARASAAPA
jgi:hypothetical protein